jgi:hypothetical protein
LMSEKIVQKKLRRHIVLHGKKEGTPSAEHTHTHTIRINE